MSDDDCPACGGCGVFEMHVCPCVEDPGRSARIQETLDKIAERRKAQPAEEGDRMKTMDVLRQIFHRIEPGDTVELDGPEEPSGRVGFTLSGPDGEMKTCGVTPGYVTLPAAPGESPQRKELQELTKRVLALVDSEGHRDNPEAQ